MWHYSALDSRAGVGGGTLWLGRQSAGFLKRFLHLASNLSEFTACGYYKEDQFLSLNSPPLLKHLQGFQLLAAQKSHTTALPSLFTPLVSDLALSSRFMCTCPHSHFHYLLCCMCCFLHTDTRTACLCTCFYTMHTNQLLVCGNVERKCKTVWKKMFGTLFNWWAWLNYEEIFYCELPFIISAINAFSVIRHFEHKLKKSN